MITGSVNARLEPVVPLQIKDDANVDHDIHAVIDTGFTGNLVLPTPIVTQLGLSWVKRSQVLIAFGRKVWTDYYAAIIIWNGRHRRIEVAAGGSEPLIGTELLEGSHLSVEFFRNGNVLIDDLP